MSVSKLKQIIPCPSDPKDILDREEILNTQQGLSLDFPDDFIEFIESYGSGCLACFYHVWNPFNSKIFLKYVDDICWHERDFKRMYPESVPYEIYPNTSGFLPWGSDDNGNYYGWLTKGEPNEWKVMTNEVRGDGYELHHVGFLDYFLEVFAGNIEPLASGYPNKECYKFRSY